jgi:hypothetical protein
VRRGRWRATRVEEVEGISGEEEVDKWPEPGAGVAAHLTGEAKTKGGSGLITLSPLSI